MRFGLASRNQSYDDDGLVVVVVVVVSSSFGVGGDDGGDAKFLLIAKVANEPCEKWVVE